MTDILQEAEQFLETNVVQPVEAFFTNTVEPAAQKAVIAVENVVETWAKQFESDFGKAALTEAVSAVNAFATGGFPAVPAIAASVTSALEAQGLSIAESDAQTVILNAARTALTAAATPAS